MPAPNRGSITSLPLSPSDTRGVGRPAKPKEPPTPKFLISDYEQQWYDYFIAVYKDNYPDLTASDNLLLMLAGIEFIKYLRVAGAELASNEVISQAKQHPGSMMNQLLDRLSITRRAREKKPREEEDVPEFLKGFMVS